MGTRILVVDDEPAIGKLLLYQLAEHGYQASYIQNGLQALQRVLTERPDLVLLDVMMPLISGWEVCRQIRACSTVPVIMLTGKSAESDMVTGMQAGADDYITKPFSMAQLQARIESVLRRSSDARSGQPHAELASIELGGAQLLLEPATPALVLSDEPAAPAPGESRPRTLAHAGAQLRDARTARGYTLHHTERACGIRWEFLQAIEQENWDYIPRRELQRTLAAYGEFLGLDVSELQARARARARPWQALIYALALVLALAFVAVVYLWL